MRRVMKEMINMNRPITGRNIFTSSLESCWIKRRKYKFGQFIESSIQPFIFLTPVMPKNGDNVALYDFSFCIQIYRYLSGTLCQKITWQAKS